MSVDYFEEQRRQMVAAIRAITDHIGAQISKSELDDRVLQAIAKVPRHEFVPVEVQHYAYLNRPLPIGFDKTISKPLMVAVMTDLLELKPNDVVLEIGTGLGYQAAVLAELSGKVYSVEIIDELAPRAVQRLKRQGYTNVEVRIGNGYSGWPETLAACQKVSCDQQCRHFVLMISIEVKGATQGTRPMLLRQVFVSVGAVLVVISVHANSAQALSMKECSAKYKAAKEAGTLGGMKWNDFRKAQCGAAATTEPTPSTAPSPPTPQPPKAAAAKPSPTPVAPGNPVFPSTVSPKYSGESAGKARMQTCLDQYRANKASGANGGLKWIEKGGGYYSECNKRLKGAA